MASLLCAAPLKLATVGFTQVGLTDAKARFYTEHFATRLAEQRDVRVTTPKDMAALLGIERQKQLMGCADGTNCMAELAGALGADGIISGQVAHVGKKYQLNVKILSADGLRSLYVHSSNLLAGEEDVIAELSQVAPEAIRAVREQLEQLAATATPNAAAATPPGPAPAAATDPTAAAISESGHGHAAWKLAPAAVGLVAIIVGAVALNFASNDYRALDSSNWANLDPASAQSSASNGKLGLVSGITLASAGVVALAAGFLWFFLTGND